MKEKLIYSPNAPHTVRETHGTDKDASTGYYGGTVKLLR